MEAWNRKSENDDSVESRRLKTATVSVPACVVIATSVASYTSKPQIPNNVKEDKVNYNESYIKYGFVSTLCDPPLPLCVICNQVLSSNSMRPFLLHRHLVTNHGEFKDKPVEFFKLKAENISKTSNVIHNFTQSSKVALVASYELALLAAKTKSTYTAM
jgi:hypothetical protein